MPNLGQVACHSASVTVAAVDGKICKAARPEEAEISGQAGSLPVRPIRCSVPCPLHLGHESDSDSPTTYPPTGTLTMFVLVLLDEQRRMCHAKALAAL